MKDAALRTIVCVCVCMCVCLCVARDVRDFKAAQPRQQSQSYL